MIGIVCMEADIFSFQLIDSEGILIQGEDPNPGGEMERVFLSSLVLA